jgi:hypothetical protein
VDEHVAAYLGAALVAVVVATILVTFVLLLVRKSPTPSAVGSLDRSHTLPAAASSRGRRSAIAPRDSIGVVRPMRAV